MTTDTGPGYRDSDEQPDHPSDQTARDRDRSPLSWLLLLPLLVTLYPPLYNRRTPELFSIPFFYWYQLATVVVGVACTVVVYRATRSR